MKVGYDNKGNELFLHDICNFTINDKEYCGMIKYDENDFSFVFEMLNDNFLVVLMNKADLYSIERIINVWSTKIGDKYGDYRKLLEETEFI